MHDKNHTNEEPRGLEPHLAREHRRERLGTQELASLIEEIANGQASDAGKQALARLAKLG